MSAAKILITGGTGFVGSHIISSLQELHPECELSIFDLPPRSAWRDPRPNIHYVQGDVRNRSDCQRAILKVQPDAVIHTAGVVPTANERYSQRNCDFVFSINVEGTRNMLEAAKEGKVKAFVLTASITMVTDDNGTDYPNFDEETPMSPTLVYGQSKV
jgi:sterol-4alpha-carboxylate 3-dehydrogenase (decarboxylating)